VVYIDVPTIFGDALSVKVTITTPLLLLYTPDCCEALQLCRHCCRCPRHCCAPPLFSALVGLKWWVVFVCVCERGEEDAAAEAVDRLAAGRRCMVCIAI
jgi:hypothetical protein